jgi:ABC-2 type transport system ATP-binding protein
VLRTEGTRTLVELEPGCDDQMVLRAALATGPVREFRRDVARLSDLFRHGVTETEEG